MSSYLITGIAGGVAQRVAELLLARGDAVVGVDYRSTGAMPEALTRMTTYRANYNKTAIEDVFRRHTFDAVLHLGRVGNLKEHKEKRFDLNVLGSQKLMNLCLAHGVRSLVVLSTFHIYGAHPLNHIPIAEDEPLRAGFDYPQLADAIQLDNMAATWVYRHPGVKIAVLRPTNVVGATVRNTMSSILRAPRVPHLLGFNPMTQFVHGDDVARAVVAAASGDARGVFNVAGDAVLPWRAALEIAGAKTFPLPGGIARAYLRAFSSFPAYLLNFLKYPCVISDAAFRKAFAWAPEVSARETLLSTVAEVRRTSAS